MSTDTTDAHGTIPKTQRGNMNPFDDVRMSQGEIITELQFLMGTDSADRLATRLGYKNLKALVDALRKTGHGNLADQLKCTGELPLDSMHQAKAMGLDSPAYSSSARAKHYARQHGQVAA